MSAVDKPPLPKTFRSPWLYVLGALSVLVCTGYVYAAQTGWESREPERNELDPTVRSSPGGYRSYHFWHSGYHGGK